MCVIKGGAQVLWNQSLRRLNQVTGSSLAESILPQLVQIQNGSVTSSLCFPPYAQTLKPLTAKSALYTGNFIYPLSISLIAASGSHPSFLSCVESWYTENNRSIQMKQGGKEADIFNSPTGLGGFLSTGYKLGSHGRREREVSKYFH